MGGNDQLKKYIFFILFLLWGSYVLFSFFKLSEFTFLPGLLNALYLSLGIFLHPSQIINVFSGLAGSISLLLGSYFIGSLVTRETGAEDGFPGKFIVSGGIGLAIFCFLIFILGISGSLNKLLLGVIFWGGGAAGVSQIWAERKKIKLPISLVKEKDIFTVFCLILALAAFWLDFIAVLSPENHFDALVYHLALPAAYLKAGKIFAVPGNIFSYFSQNTEMLYAFCLASSGDLAARLLHFFFGLGCSALLYLIGKRLFGRKSGIFAACLFWLVPQVGMETWAALNDLSASFFVLLNLYFLTLVPLTAGRARTVRICLSALAAGVALSVKYVTAPAVIISFLFLYYYRDKEKGRRGFAKELFLFLIILLPVALPWQIRNIVIKGAPFYPFFTSKLTGFKFVEYYNDCGHSLYFTGLYDFFLKPWFLVLDEKSLNSLLGPVFLFALPLLAFSLLRRSETKKVFFYFLVFFVVWRLASENWRFFLPGLGGLCLLIAAIVVDGPFDNLNKALLKFILAALLIGNLGLLYQGFNLKEAVPVVTGRQTAAFYLSKNHIFYQNPYYPAVDFINNQLPNSSLTLFVGETRGYYCEKKFIASTAFEEPVFQKYYKKASTGAELAKLLKADGITHILFNELELARLQMQYRTYDFSAQDLRVLSEFWQQHSLKLYIYKSVGIYEIR